ncbi:uncharacterized protein LOC133883442 [Phragmites australis]|uniref:uncharacterized protein LOC133883442 n=1 Tax=Phragmites australis TaxID=29695 RepID=UPI002D776398|nr:uncharacterized protein LOC133883442 [Phragmites australis]
MKNNKYPETATHVHTGNMLFDPPEYSASLLHILPRGTVNHKGVTGISFEEKSGDHVLRNGCLKAETDPRSSSCKRTSGRFEDGGHENEPADPNITVQTSLHRESSNLMLNNMEAILQNLNADTDRLENSSDAPNEY